MMCWYIGKIFDNYIRVSVLAEQETVDALDRCYYFAFYT